MAHIDSDMQLDSATSPLRNDISVDQDRTDSIDLLRARNRVYGRAKVIQGIFVLATILIGVLGSFVSVEHKPFFGLLGIFALLIDVVFLESYIKSLCRLGAQLGEDFDIKVLRLPRNQLVSGSSVLPEDIRKYSARPLDDARELNLRRWYEPPVSQVSLPIGRLICQRTNITYDSRLRYSYSSRLLLVVWPLICAVLLLSLLLEMRLDATVTLVSSLLPLLNWMSRELRKQFDAQSQLEKLRGEFDRLWGRALNRADDEELRVGSRCLQDAIFQHRANTNLVMDWLYQCMRPQSEDEAAAAAKKLVEEARATLGPSA